MTTPLTLWHGILLDQVLVDGAASLVNLVIHAVLLGAVVWTVRIAVKDTFVPSFLQYSIIIVFTGRCSSPDISSRCWSGPSPIWSGLAPPSVDRVDPRLRH